jgi:hypothetical protein
MQHGDYERLDFRRIRFVRERSYDKMRLARPDAKKHVVTIKTATRDEKTGKMTYVTVESIDVFESNDNEVKNAVMAGLNNAAKSK